MIYCKKKATILSFVAGKVIGGAGTVKGNDAECFGEKPVFGEGSHQTIRVHEGTVRDL